VSRETSSTGPARDLEPRSLRRFERYVAIGDSTTEGIDDPYPGDPADGYRGWANRLAERIATLQGSPLLYANLAVRGRRTRQVKDEQLARAAAMRPDLATVVSGTNDMLRPSFDAEAVAAEVEEMQRVLIAGGATVLTFTLPDLTPVMPISRLFAERARRLAEALRRAAAHSGAILVDFAQNPVASDSRLWCADRLHANSLGHERTAAALAHALGLPEADESWSEPLPAAAPRTRAQVLAAELTWAYNHLLPWAWRHLQGRSSGDGRVCKRPELRPFPE
jgi:lysophospholipase L1-like esterase